MQKDTRSFNSYFEPSSISKYLDEYSRAISHGLSQVPEGDIESAKNLLLDVLAVNGRIFVGGNGGSAAISDHLMCDFVKGTVSEKRNNLIVHSLVGSQALFSAIGNDLGYQNTLSFQLEANRVCEKDVVILISSSGNSPNIVKAALLAQERGAKVLGLTGFSGGDLYELADVRLHVPVNNYGVVEDCHQALMHVLAQFHFVTNG